MRLFPVNFAKCNPLARTSSSISLEPQREREALQLNTHTVTQKERERRKLNTMDAGAWETGFPGFPTHKCTITSSQTYTLIWKHTERPCQTRTCTIMQHAQTFGSERINSFLHWPPYSRVAQDSSIMYDLSSAPVFFSQTSISDPHPPFNKTGIIRLRKSCEKGKRRKRTTLQRISVIVPTHITFLTADSQPSEDTA